MALSPDDAAAISTYGYSLLGNFALVSPALILYGIYLVLFPYSVIILSRKSRKTVATYWLLALTSGLFLCFVLYVAIGIAVLVIQFQDYLIKQVFLSDDPPSGDTSITRLNRLFLFVNSLTFIIADTIVMWRALVLYGGKKIIRAFMAITVVVNALLFLADLILNEIPTARELTVDPSVNAGIDSASIFFSFATNLLATILIGYRAWGLREHMRWLTSSRKRSQVEGILILLVETGLGFCIIQLTSAIITLFDSDTESSVHIADQAIGAISNSLAAVLPTLIIIVVQRDNTSVIDGTVVLNDDSQKTVKDSDRAGGSDQPMSTLRFASIGSTQVEESQNTRGRVEGDGERKIEV